MRCHHCSEKRYTMSHRRTLIQWSDTWKYLTSVVDKQDTEVTKTSKDSFNFISFVSLSIFISEEWRIQWRVSVAKTKIMWNGGYAWDKAITKLPYMPKTNKNPPTTPTTVCFTSLTCILFPHVFSPHLRMSTLYSPPFFLIKAWKRFIIQRGAPNCTTAISKNT